jgi:hypothetical protein
LGALLRALFGECSDASESAPNTSKIIRHPSPPAIPTVKPTFANVRTNSRTAYGSCRLSNIGRYRGVPDAAKADNTLRHPVSDRRRLSSNNREELPIFSIGHMLTLIITLFGDLWPVKSAIKIAEKWPFPEIFDPYDHILSG